MTVRFVMREIALAKTKEKEDIPLIHLSDARMFILKKNTPILHLRTLEQFQVKAKTRRSAQGEPLLLRGFTICYLFSVFNTS